MLETNQLEFFEEQGYFTLDNLLVDDRLQQIRHAFDRLDSYRNLLDLDTAFLPLANHPVLCSAIESILQSPPQLLQFDAINRCPGQGAQTWHADFLFYCNRPLMLNVGIYLDTLTVENGPLYVVPGSHRYQTPPARTTEDLADQQIMTVTAGSAVIFDCALWHRGGGNFSQQPRRAIFPTYGHYWMKRFESWMPASTEERFPNADSPQLRTLLGISLDTPSAYSGYNEKEMYRKDPDGNWL